jgi:hypothetical protein
MKEDLIAFRSHPTALQRGRPDPATKQDMLAVAQTSVVE